MATIGDLERRAGIGSSDVERTAFWLRFHHLDGKACLNAGVAALKRMIAEREEGTELRTGESRRQRWPALSDDQKGALQSYADRHGRRWKSILSAVWMGGLPHDDGGILRGLRNTHGPTWLQSYQLPKAALGGQSDGIAAVSYVGAGEGRSKAGWSHIHVVSGDGTVTVCPSVLLRSEPASVRFKAAIAPQAA